MHGQNNSSFGLNAPMTQGIAQSGPGELHETLSDQSTWTEIISERKQYSSTYKTPEGQTVTSYSTRPLNYYDATGHLVPIDPSLKPNGDGWNASNQPNPTYLYPDGSAAVSINKCTRFTFGKNCFINDQPITTKAVSKKNEIIYPDVVPGIDKQFLFYENAIKYNYILHGAVNSNEQFFRIKEELAFPEGCKLIRNTERGSEENGGWSGDLLLVNDKGEIVSKILAPLCYDADKNFTFASYIIKESEGKHFLEMQLPISWITRPFPAS